MAGTPGIIITEPNGSLNLSEDVIVATRHIHASDYEAVQYGLQNGDRESMSRAIEALNSTMCW